MTNTIYFSKFKLFYTTLQIYKFPLENSNKIICFATYQLFSVKTSYKVIKRKTLSIYHRQEGVIINTQILIFNIPHPIFTDQEKLIIFKKVKFMSNVYKQYSVFYTRAKLALYLNPANKIYMLCNIFFHFVTTTLPSVSRSVSQLMILPAHKEGIL